MRKTGTLDTFERLIPGDHVCWVLDAHDDYERAATACLADGEQRGEKLFLFGPRAASSSLLHRDGVQGVDPSVDVLAGKSLNPETMFAMFRTQSALAREEGYRGIRIVADMAWLQDRLPDPGTLMAFELRLDEIVTELRASVVCAYRSSIFDAQHLRAQLSVHPLVGGATLEDLGFRMWNATARTWVVSGEIDHANAGAFEHALRAVAADAQDSLTLDLQSLRFIDVFGIRAIVRTAGAHPGTAITLRAASGTLARCWRILGFHDSVPTVTFGRADHRLDEGVRA